MCTAKTGVELFHSTGRLFPPGRKYFTQQLWNISTESCGIFPLLYYTSVAFHNHVLLSLLGN